MGAYQSQSRRFGVTPPRGLGRVVEQGDPLGRLTAEMDPVRLEAALEVGRAMSPEELTAYVLDLFDRMGPPGPSPAEVGR